MCRFLSCKRPNDAAQIGQHLSVMWLGPFGEDTVNAMLAASPSTSEGATLVGCLSPELLSIGPGAACRIYSVCHEQFRSMECRTPRHLSIPLCRVGRIRADVLIPPIVANIITTNYGRLWRVTGDGNFILQRRACDPWRLYITRMAKRRLWDRLYDKMGVRNSFGFRVNRNI
jgi:hypothetical protein